MSESTICGALVTKEMTLSLALSTGDPGERGASYSSYNWPRYILPQGDVPLIGGGTLIGLKNLN